MGKAHLRELGMQTTMIPEHCQALGMVTSMLMVLHGLQQPLLSALRRFFTEACSTSKCRSCLLLITQDAVQPAKSEMSVHLACEICHPVGELCHAHRVCILLGELVSLPYLICVLFWTSAQLCSAYETTLNQIVFMLTATTL